MKLEMDEESRPNTYWPESLNQEQLLSRIKGRARQDIARRILHEEGFQGLNSFIAQETLSRTERDVWGSGHPWLMGGEYLPDLEDGEVEIVRIDLASTTRDQISVRAMRVDDRIRYRVVGEYEEPLFQMPFSSSNKPLSLAELVELVDGTSQPGDIYPGGLVTANWEAGFDANQDVGEAMSFVSLKSDFYPDLGRYYELAAEDWIAAHKIDEEGLDMPVGSRPK